MVERALGLLLASSGVAILARRLSSQSASPHVDARRSPAAASRGLRSRAWPRLGGLHVLRRAAFSPRYIGVVVKPITPLRKAGGRGASCLRQIFYRASYSNGVGGGASGRPGDGARRTRRRPSSPSSHSSFATARVAVGCPVSARPPTPRGDAGVARRHREHGHLPRACTHLRPRLIVRPASPARRINTLARSTRRADRPTSRARKRGVGSVEPATRTRRPQPLAGETPYRPRAVDPAPIARRRRASRCRPVRSVMRCRG